MQVYAFDLMPWPHLAQASYYPDPNRLYDPALGRQVYDEHFRQMELYEECGYDAICINEHHAKPYGLMPSPNLIAAVLTQRTRRIKIGIFGNLPALHAHPVRLAEEVAMLDVMSGGRVISGFVRGVPQEFLAYSMPLADARRPHDRGVGSRREGVDGARAVRVARQVLQLRSRLDLAAPAPGAASADPAARRQRRRARDRGQPPRADRLRLPLGRPGARRVRSLSRAGRESTDGRPGPEHCHLVRHVYVAETNARAREEAEPHLDYFWQKLLSYHRGSMALMGQSPPPRPARIEKAEDLPLYELDFDLCQKEGPVDRGRSRLRRPRDPAPRPASSGSGSSSGSSSSARCRTPSP